MTLLSKSDTNFISSSILYFSYSFSAFCSANFFDILDKSAEEAEGAEQPTVEIYVTSWCAYCHAAKKYFRSRGIEFTVYDIEKDSDAARRMMAMTNRRAVPFVVINGHGIQGYSEQAYELALQN